MTLLLVLIAIALMATSVLGFIFVAITTFPRFSFEAHPRLRIALIGCASFGLATVIVVLLLEARG